MNERQQNRLNMFKAVQDFLREQGSITATIPAFPDAVREFNDTITAIDDAAVKHATATLGKTDKKWEAEEKLVSILLRVKAAAYACARNSGNHEVRAAVELSESDLRRRRDSELVREAGIICDHAVSMPGIDRFGGTPDLFESARDATAAFESALRTREVSVKGRTVTRSDLGELFRRAEEALAEDLDTLVELFRDIDPAFYDGYHAVRIARTVTSKPRNGGTPDSTAPAAASPGVAQGTTPAA